MKRNLPDYFVALFVIACSVVLLGALTFALTGRQLKKPTRMLQINYEDVTGVKVNSEVRYAGAPAPTRAGSGSSAWTETAAGGVF